MNDNRFDTVYGQLRNAYAAISAHEVLLRLVVVIVPFHSPMNRARSRARAGSGAVSRSFRAGVERYGSTTIEMTMMAWRDFADLVSSTALIGRRDLILLPVRTKAKTGLLPPEIMFECSDAAVVSFCTEKIMERLITLLSKRILRPFDPIL
jgi:hypothetical protein